MATVRRMPLSRFFGLFAPTHVLGTTFSLSLAFFESAVLPQIRRTNLRRCLILCDRVGLRRATVEAGALRAAGREYMTVCAPAPASFHAKVWIMAGPADVAVLVGSGNLTQSGFFENVELFDVVHLRAGGPGRAVALGLAGFLSGLARLWPDDGTGRPLAVETLEYLRHAVAKLGDGLSGDDDNDVRFLHSFDGPLAAQLAGSAPGGTLHVAAPYFGGATAGLSLLLEHVRPDRVRVYPADHGGGTADVGREDLESLPGVSVHALRLARRDDSFPFAHLKLYGLEGEGQTHTWIFTTSANCTVAALGGANVEAGLLRRTDPATLAAYFAEGRPATIPTRLRQPDARGEGHWLPLWATDRGEAVEIAIPEVPGLTLPLHEARIAVNCGGTLSETALAATLFARGRVEVMPWSMFPGLGDRATRPSLFTVSARAADGLPVMGAAFVDNYLLLVADPVHRSAWRGTLALLAGEGLPEVADLVGIFRLVQDVFDASEAPNGDREIAEDGDGRAAAPIHARAHADHLDKVPIWPPTAAPTLDGLSHIAGQVQNLPWFQKILAQLLRPPNHEDVPLAAGLKEVEPAGDEPTGGGNDDELPEDEEATIGARRTLWNQAARSQERLRRRLMAMEPSRRMASRLWPVAVAHLLVTLLTRRHAAGRYGGDLQLPPVADLVKGFLAALFIERPQHEDYHPREGGRYPGTVFPPLAAGLHESFGQGPHDDLAKILLLLFAHWYAHQQRSHETFPDRAWLLFRDVASRDVIDNADLGWLHALHHKYLVDETGTVGWDDVVAALERLRRSGWIDLPGYATLGVIAAHILGPANGTPDGLAGRLHHTWPIARSRARAGKPWGLPVDPLEGCCTAPGCPAFYVAAPELSRLRELEPEICHRCGAVLVPERLWHVFWQTHGKNA
jgi:hypothetical protein